MKKFCSPLVQNALPLILLFGLVLQQDQAWARRHKKFKGIIIVNQILKLDGTITNNGNPVAEYSGIHQGDVLETGDKSRAVVRIPGLAVFRLGANTKVKFTKFNDRNTTQIDLLKGELLSLYRRTGEHELFLNHSHIKIHGTTLFTMSSLDNPKDEICLCDGKAQITALTPAEKEDDADSKSKKHKHKKNESAENTEETLGAVRAIAASGNAPSTENLTAIAASKGATISAVPTSTPIPTPAKMEGSGAVAPTPRGAEISAAPTFTAGSAAASASPSPGAPPIFNDVSKAVNQTDAAKNGHAQPGSTPANTPATAVTATPTAPSLEKEIQLSSDMAHKQCEASEKGVEIKASNTLLGLHSNREIKDLESLYGLP